MGRKKGSGGTLWTAQTTPTELCMSTTDVFHGHPECTEHDDETPFGNLTMEEAYEAHLNRVQYLEDQGFTVRVKWSCEWLKERKSADVAQFLLSMNLREPLSPRDASKGGRTNAAKLFYEVQPGEKILHFDIVSLYPTVNKKDKHPVGHPEIILNNFQDIGSYFGFVFCRVQPPNRLLFPVLPSIINGKLVFSFCRTCAKKNLQTYCQHGAAKRALEGVWCAPELQKVINSGYIAEQVFEVWNWKETKTGLFEQYANHFLKEKIEATGWPEWCVNDEAKTQYVTRVKEREGNDIDPTKMENNPGLRQVAKLMLNSFWGKWGQRDNLHQTKFVYDPKKCFDLLRSESEEIHDVFAVSPESMMVTTSMKDDYNENNNTTNIPLASLTTSWARLRLLTMMRNLRPGDWMPETGDILGEWSSEIKPGESHIVRLVSCGPKVYSYIIDTKKTETKIKGLTQNGLTEDLLEYCDGRQAFERSGRALDFDQLKRLKDGTDTELKVIYPEYLRKNGKTQSITTVSMTKRLGKVYNKRVLLPDYSTISFGTVNPISAD